MNWIKNIIEFTRIPKRKRLQKRDEAPAIPRSIAYSLQFPGAAQQVSGQNISLQTFEQMLRDPLIRSAVTIKKYGALAVPWRIVPAPENGGASEDARKRADFVEYAFAEMQGSITGVLLDAMDAIAKGYAILEKIFVEDTRKYPGKIRFEAIRPKDPSLFGFEVDEFLNIKGLTLHVPGESVRSLPVEKFVIFVYQQRYGFPSGESDLIPAHKHWAIKRELLKQWSSHLDKFASPTVLGKFKRGLPESAQTQLLDALEKLARQSAVVYPDDIEVSLLEGGREARSGYLEAIDYHNREMARAILGQTLVTEDSRRIGSLALGKVHLQVLIMQLAGLRRELAERVVNEQLIRPLIDLNFGAGSYPMFEFVEPELDVFRTGKVV
ncbi:MAG TPA: DUF935 family protein [Fimbriimonadales bacterium]|nr:DUF935 family protein [Fimbriimonadales bacterium]